MKTLFKKTSPILFFSMLVLLGMSCSTLSDRHPDSSNENTESRWANPMENPTLDRIQSR